MLTFEESDPREKRIPPSAKNTNTVQHYQRTYAPLYWNGRGGWEDEGYLGGGVSEGSDDDCRVDGARRSK